MMKSVTLLGVVGLAAVACGQPIETITYSIEWDMSVMSTGTNTGGVYATVTPAIGTQTAWNSAPGKGQAGIVKAFASSIYNTVNLENGTKGTLTWTVPEEWNIAKAPGTPDGNGGILATNAGQFGPALNPAPNTNPKVKILDLKWTFNGPADSFKVSYGTKATSGKVYLDVGLSTWVGENAVKVDGVSEFFVIMPAPTAMAVLAFAGIVAGRRGRREI